MHTRHYFDHNATTPLSREALECMTQALGEVFGNASSIHHYGQAAKRSLEGARRQVAALLGVSPQEIVWVSGGTEANNLAIFGSCPPGSHLLTTAIEHPAVLQPCARLERQGCAVTCLPPGSDGRIRASQVRQALRPDTALISVMHANNETGVIQPVEEIAAVAREAGVRFHIDGVQAAGKLPTALGELGCDFYSLSGHKLGGPKGLGVLYVRKDTAVEPLLFGGHQERDRRAGTENVPAAMALGAAAAWWSANGTAERARMAALRDHLEARILAAIPDAVIHGAGAPRLPNTTSVAIRGIEGEPLVIALDLRGFAVSSGSACSSGAVEPSHVLLAMGLAPQDARSSIRISLGRGNTLEQVDALADALCAATTALRRVSATYSHV